MASALSASIVSRFLTFNPFIARFKANRRLAELRNCSYPCEAAQAPRCAFQALWRKGHLAVVKRPEYSFPELFSFYGSRSSVAEFAHDERHRALLCRNAAPDPAHGLLCQRRKRGPNRRCPLQRLQPRHEWWNLILRLFTQGACYHPLGASVRQSVCQFLIMLNFSSLLKNFA